MRMFVSSFVLTFTVIAAALTGAARSGPVHTDTSKSDKTDSTSSDTDPDPVPETGWVITDWTDTASFTDLTDITKTDTSVTSLEPKPPWTSRQLRWQRSTTPKVFPIQPLWTAWTETAPTTAFHYDYEGLQKHATIPVLSTTDIKLDIIDETPFTAIEIATDTTGT